MMEYVNRQEDHEKIHCHQLSHFKGENAPNSVQDPLRERAALSRLPSWISVALKKGSKRE